MRMELDRSYSGLILAQYVTKSHIIEILLKLTETNTKKGHLYKTYIVQVLIYGFKRLSINKTDINLIERVENSILRTVYNIPNRCKTSN
ncbi:hypothetical protein BpHYR1_053727 [Brachionus plicatilis]|uniref:Uncharacterized protein n=1 Tax=Brachionus plicatilis TaxID=10195 RepID=A0A3M7Q4Y4_BRAPC|nr:hypothetical protein BpHYR1_053727 [Brachionus plicatilis]